MLDEKDTYTIQELIGNLPVSLRALAIQCNLNEATLARLRKGRATMPTTINKLLPVLSQVYGKRLTRSNVTGIVMRDEETPITA